MQPLTVTSPYEKCRVGNLKGRGLLWQVHMAGHNVTVVREESLKAITRS